MGERLDILEADMIPLLERLSLRTLDDFVSGVVGTVVAERGSAQTRKITLDGAAGECYLKVYRDPRPGWRSIVMRDRCRTEARNYSVLRERCGEVVPRVIATGRRRRSGRLCECFILTHGVPNSVPLDQWLDRLASEGGVAAASKRKLALANLADLIARMHAAGFFHVDLQLRNVLVSDSGDAAPRFYLIDSSRGGPRGWRIGREYGRFRDLSSLHKGASGRVSEREELRWLLRYRGARRLSVADRALVTAILADRRKKDHKPA
ncbi:MAG: hypothetical protein KF841_14445 [Phycisphaerae bacterium]|nr:hypothetical protein [Phycisphaerae bacterium]